MTRLHWMVAATFATLAFALTVVLTRPTTFEFAGTKVEAAPSVSDVTLVNAAGHTVRLGAWRGITLLVFFGYASCPDVCPLTMANLARIYRDLGEPTELQVIMVTVDPERDAPDALQAYVERFHPDFIGLTGTGQQVVDAAARFYASAVKHEEGEVAHSSHVTLVDPEGRMRAVYTQRNVGEVLKNDLEGLLSRASAW